MIRFATLARLASVGMLAIALSGCISLLPKTKPVQLYRFGLAATPAETAAPETPREPPPPGVGVFWANGTFEREAAGDGILSITGERVAYIAGSRWAAPADTLFDQAVFAAFDRDVGHVRLVPRGAPTPTDYVLRVDVRNFETHYQVGAKGPPRILVRIHATLTRDRQRTLVSDEEFQAIVPAERNRVTSIVAAYDKAVRQVLGDLLAWVNKKTA